MITYGGNMTDRVSFKTSNVPFIYVMMTSTLFQGFIG